MKIKNLCLAGGVALLCCIKILKDFIFDNIWINSMSYLGPSLIKMN